MNRADLQQLSDTRIREAKILLAAGEFSGAYYLSGYAVECALKACYAKSIKRYDFPEKTVSKVFIHNLKDLARLVGLDTELERDAQSDPQLDGSWLLVCRWTEQSRYATWTHREAEQLLQAITSRRGGVLPWIKRRW